MPVLSLIFFSRSTTLPRSRFILTLLFVNFIIISRLMVAVSPSLEAELGAPTRCARSTSAGEMVEFRDLAKSRTTLVTSSCLASGSPDTRKHIVREYCSASSCLIWMFSTLSWSSSYWFLISSRADFVSLGSDFVSSGCVCNDFVASSTFILTCSLISCCNSALTRCAILSRSCSDSPGIVGCWKPIICGRICGGIPYTGFIVPGWDPKSMSGPGPWWHWLWATKNRFLHRWTSKIAKITRLTRCWIRWTRW